ncbi:MAG: hypothetical protein AAGJ34_06575 [Pseudomonadota bacterium]
MKVDRRPPETVMRLSRLGSLHQCRLSFMRQLTRRMARENWRFERSAFDINDMGIGYAVYTAHAPDHSYSLVAFAHDLPADQRSDRVIAEAWDATFALYDGVPDAADIERLAKNVPVQEAGRVSERELSLSRANRSVRLWAHVVDRLAEGLQPDVSMIDAVGYLMRTTAVYGSGKFGAADRENVSMRSELQSPFQVEMLTVYLIRTFVRDLVQHLARSKNTQAAKLDPSIARRLGIGNSTGLGMAPFIINHQVLFNNWIMVREEALARVRSVDHADKTQIDVFLSLWSRTKALVSEWTSDHPIQREKLDTLRRDVSRIDAALAAFPFTQSQPWDALFQFSETLSEEGQELLVSLMLEPYPDLVDGLASCMSDALQVAHVIDGTMSVAQARTLIESAFAWATKIDWSARDCVARAWYVSAEKLEPRLGERFEEPIADYEQPLAPARDAAAALDALSSWPDEGSVAEFLLKHPAYRHVIRRAQLHQIAPYGEIQDNTISAELRPIDMLRAKLSFFGAIHFDPRSDRWVRICMYSGAPYPEELNPDNADFWVYPERLA